MKQFIFPSVPHRVTIRSNLFLNRRVKYQAVASNFNPRWRPTSNWKLEAGATRETWKDLSMLSSTCQTFQKRPTGKAKCTSEDESNRTRKVSYLKSRYMLASAFELELSGSSAKPSKRKTYTRKRGREIDEGVDTVIY